MLTEHLITLSKFNLSDNFYHLFHCYFLVLTIHFYKEDPNCIHFVQFKKQKKLFFVYLSKQNCYRNNFQVILMSKEPVLRNVPPINTFYGYKIANFYIPFKTGLCKCLLICPGKFQMEKNTTRLKNR